MSDLSEYSKKQWNIVAGFSITAGVLNGIFAIAATQAVNTNEGEKQPASQPCNSALGAEAKEQSATNKERINCCNMF